MFGRIIGCQNVFNRPDRRFVKIDRFRVRKRCLCPLRGAAEVFRGALVRFRAFKMIAERRGKIFKAVGEKLFESLANRFVQLFPTREQQ